MKESGGIFGMDPEQTLLGLFDELPFAEKWRRVLEGLSRPEQSGEHKWAKLQILRLWGPVCGLAVPFLCVFLLMIAREVEVLPGRTVAIVEKPEPMPEQEKPEPIEREEDDLTVPDVKIENHMSTEGHPVDTESWGDSRSEPHLEAVANIKSRLMLKGIPGTDRTPGAIAEAVRRHAPRSAPSTEAAVLRALRWLKKKQESDGSWDQPKPAMTGLALLAYLGHGETPVSGEFGPTVEKGMKWLVGNIRPDGTFAGKDDHGYSNPIGTYALCEAYGMTKVPMLRDVAERGVDAIIRGQHATGGWNYNYDGANRDDTSVMAWCVQAVKAAKMAGLQNPGLDDCMAKAVLGMKKNIRGDGGWNYITGAKVEESHGRLAGAGVLALQFLGAGRDEEAARGLLWLKDASFDWHNPWGSRPIYHWYYVTQAKFHAGGETWNSWNRQFSPALVHNQVVLKGAGVDGKDIGYWESVSAEEQHGLVYNTTLCCLMLEVYYRYLPTFRPPEAAPERIGPENKEDIDVTISAQTARRCGYDEEGLLAASAEG